MSCHVMSCHVISYHIISYHIILCGHFPILLLYLYATHGFSRLVFFCVASLLVHLRFNDTTLLSTLHLMDYSLLLAAKSPKSPSRSSGQLSMGIIDYLRAYTMDKKVESTIKSLGTSLTQSHPEQPTIIHPTEQLWKEDLGGFCVFHHPFCFSFGGNLLFENKRMNQKRVQNLQSTNSSILFYQHNFTWLGDIVYISLVKLTISLGFPFNHFQWNNHREVFVPSKRGPRPRYAARFLRAMGTYFVADCVEMKEEEESSRWNIAMGSPPRGGPYDVHKISEKRGKEKSRTVGAPFVFGARKKEVNFLGELVWFVLICQFFSPKVEWWPLKQQDHIGDLHVIFLAFCLGWWTAKITEFIQKSISGCNPLEPKVLRGAPRRKKTTSLQDKNQLACFTKYESFFEVNGIGTDLFQFELIFFLLRFGVSSFCYAWTFHHLQNVLWRLDSILTCALCIPSCPL